MKNILFVCSTLNIGGAEKSLINLLNIIDFSQYSVDLLLLHKEGEFMSQLPKEVNVIDGGVKMKCLYNKKPLRYYSFLFLFKCFFNFIETIRFHHYDELRAHRWVDFYKKICERLEKEYDVAVAYQSGDCTYFVADKVSALRKVTYFHTDISKIKLANKIEELYLNKFDLIVTISSECLRATQRQFPAFANKIVCLNNLSSPQLLVNFAGNVNPYSIYTSGDEFVILSVGRLVEIKGFELAIEASKILRDSNYKFKWFIVGEGKQRKSLEQRINDLRLSDYCFLIGEKGNPYPYFKFADLVVQTSFYEGKSMVLDEAKIFGKPIISTNYNTVHDQIVDGKNGLIVDMNAESLANSVAVLIDNSDLRIKLINNNINYKNVYSKNSINQYISKIFDN